MSAVHADHAELRALSDTDVGQLVQRVEAATLPHAEWTHAAHLTYTVALLRRDGSAALDTFRASILRLNEMHGVTQTLERGYHETITRFYVWAVARELSLLPADATLGDVATHVVACFTDRTIPLRHYTKARLMSWEARTGWVAPDLMPMEASSA